MEFSSSGTPVRHLHPPVPPPPGAQRERLDALAKLNRLHQSRHAGESDLEARIQNYELAARMQLAAMEVLDISKESEATKKLYGVDNPLTADYGLRCLMARRLVEAGVRFVQIYPGLGQPWDHHSKIHKNTAEMCAKTDQPTVALVKDLKGRGLLEKARTVRDAFDGADVGGEGGARPDVVGDPNAQSYTSKEAKILRFFNTDAFRRAQQFTFGNAGSGIVEGPGQRQEAVASSESPGRAPEGSPDI